MNPVKTLRLSKSRETMSERMDIFNVPSTDISCEGKGTIVVSNKNPLTDNVVLFEFDVGGGMMTVPDGIELEISGSIVKGDGGNLPAMPTDSWTDAATTKAKKDALQAADVYPVNQLLFGLFKYARVRVQDEYMNCNDFDIRAMLDTILKVRYGNDEKYLSQFYVLSYTDTNGKYSMIPTHPKFCNISGVLGTRISDSKSFQMRGKLPLDFCSIQKFMLSRVPISIELFFNSPSTYLMSSKENADFKFKMTDCKLHVPYVKVSPTLELANADLLKQHKEALYPYVCSVLKKFTIPSGSHTFQAEDIFQGRVPMQTVICMVSSEDASMGYTHNPYNFRTFKLGEIKFKIDQVSIDMKMKFSNTGNEIVQPYMAFTNMFPHIEVSTSNFEAQTPFFVFDTRTNYDADKLPMVRKGFSSLEMKFDEPLEKNVTAYVFATFGRVMRVDEARRVTV